MLDTSGIESTFSWSTLQNNDILFLDPVSMIFFALHTMKSGENPADLNSFTLRRVRGGKKLIERSGEL